MPYLSIGILEKRRDAKVKQLHELGPVLQGSIPGQPHEFEFIYLAS